MQYGRVFARRFVIMALALLMRFGAPLRSALTTIGKRYAGLRTRYRPSPTPGKRLGPPARFTASARLADRYFPFSRIRRGVCPTAAHNSPWRRWNGRC